MYLMIKSIHISLVAVSFIIFLSRGIMMLMGNSHYRDKVFRIIPPMIDSLLLATGITLMLILEQYPTTQLWLTVKMIALLLYILLGIIALNRANNYKVQMFSFIAAVSTILFMASVARTHHPLGIFSMLAS